ncbi:MFS transporter [Listeria seeligeri]|uniref:MDR family MFS transporter n=1 Tax=Listeria seeligeri TaxID=1640 RepID=UPI0001C4EAD2|nr:MFS transporter [Listeria seeligeri]MBC1723424.1 MFS transporter [Listeria seeligeri]MBF2346622.1 MFS transporter [Listeria seeligeri]MBF2436506.1 MFS transporter [Listeria seeligeri]MBF2480524.1 MFS transporter [Listeria seeligeri]CBH28174.1 membrane protein, putative [Listeria seeligeri serovar 1/2b str. SLCC3954]
MFRELHPNIRARILIQFLSKIIGSMIFPFLAIYFTMEINSSVAGVLLLINVFVQFVAGIYGGHLADVIGRRKLMITGEVLKVFAFLGMVLCNSPFFHSPWITFAMLLIIGVAQGLVNPAGEAMLIDVSTPENRAFMYSISYWANNLSMLIGIMVGGWFFVDYLFPLLVALLIMSFVTAWLTIILISETLELKVVPEKGSYGLLEMFKSYGQVLHDYRFLLYTIGGIAVMSIEYQRGNYISVRLAEDFQHFLVNFGPLGEVNLNGVQIVSVLTAVNTLFIVLFTVPIARWVTKRAQQPIMYVGFSLFAIGFAVCAFANSLIVLLIATAVLSIGELLYVPTRQTILATIVDDNKRGAYMAFNGIIFQIGKMIGSVSLVFAPFIGKYGMGIFTIALGIVAIGFSAVALKSGFEKVWIK